jgi:DNA repair exonuclease SbcCD nuclease subunit/DNA repair exonuclease SbcCD ATPase subunit
MEILKKDIDVKRIYFLSDIHIKNDPEHNSTYYSVFENTFKLFKNEKVNKNDLIVITGDIMDNGYAVSGNAIEMAKYLYINLSNFCPIISILGNHDIKTNIDTLTPIVKEHLKTKNELYFLLENKIYLYGQIAFGHTKMGTTEVTQCKKYNKNYITISLYHGMLKGTKFENDIDCRTNFLLSDFKDYKYCAFGDIHKQQFLREDETAFYTGSLIAQKISEDAFNHGTMKIDLEKEKIEFIKIQNIHKKLDLIIDDDGNVSNYDINKILKTTKYVDLQLTFGSYNEKNINNIKKKFEDNHIVITNFLHKPKIENLKFDTILKVENKELKLSSIIDRKTCEKFLLTYIKSKHNIDNIDRFTKNLNILLNEVIFEDQLKKKRNIEFLDIVINDILVYGNNVKIDVKKINGIVGICETNSSGKSTLCEIISLTLFDKTPRCNIGFSFVRNGQKESSCILRLISNGIEYEIKRVYTVHYKNDKKVNNTFVIKKYIDKSKDKFILYVKNDSFSKNLYKNKDVNFKSDSDMKELILKEILTYDELYQMIVISQNREKSFLEEKDKDELLFKMANLSYLKELSDKIDSVYKEAKKSIKTMLTKHCSIEFTKDYKKDFTYQQKYEHSKKILNNFEKEIKDYEENKNNKNKELFDDFQNKNNQLITLKEKIKVYEKFKNIDDNYDIDELNNNNSSVNNEIKNLNMQIKDFDKRIRILNNTIDRINKRLLKYENIEEKNDRFKEQQKKFINDLRLKILDINKNIKDVTYKKITNNNNIKYKKDHVKLEKEIKDIENKILFYREENNKINTIGGVKNLIIEYEKYLDLNNQKNKLEYELELINNYELYFKKDKNTIKKITSISEDLNKKISILLKNIDENKSIKEKYDLLKLNNNYNQILDDLQIELQAKKENQIIITDKIKDYIQEQKNNNFKEEIQKIEKKIINEEQREFKDYEIYCDLTIELNKHEKELTNLKYERELLLNTINKKSLELKKIEDILFLINENKDNYKKYKKIKKDLDRVEKEFILIEEEFNNSNALIQKDALKINDLKEKYIIAKDIIKKCAETIADIKDFELLVNILKTNGLCDKLLEEQIIVNLQKALDDTCKYIGHEKIYVDFIHTPDNESRKFNIVIRTDRIKDISNAGGFQSNIMELIFKVAFMRINTYLKTDFIIIDELFDACSEENKPIAIKLVEYYKTQYNKILLVSHNQSIINLFDKRLIIKHDKINGNNIIQN